MLYKIILSLTLSVLSIETYAHLLPQGQFVLAPTNSVEDYRLGSEWGKRKVTEADLSRSSNAFKRGAYATARLPVGGTGFYLGKFNGAHVLATNHHVCPHRNSCLGNRADFKALNKSFRVTKFYLTLPIIDLTLLQIEIPLSEEALMNKVARNFDFRGSIPHGSELMTFGFGIAGNSGNSLMANVDSDCRVFSKTGEFRLMADPDEFNPADYRAWSFSHGCDVSHGDSGSAILDRRTSNVVGIVWTGKIPKSPEVQDSEALIRLLNFPTEAIWTELSYAVPAVKIAEQLKLMIQNRTAEPMTLDVLKAMLN